MFWSTFVSTLEPDQIDSLSTKKYFFAYSLFIALHCRLEATLTKTFLKIDNLIRPCVMYTTKIREEQSSTTVPFFLFLDCALSSSEQLLGTTASKLELKNC